RRSEGFDHLRHRFGFRPVDAASLRYRLGALRFRRSGPGRAERILAARLAFLPRRPGTATPQRCRSAALPHPLGRAGDRLPAAGPGDGCAWRRRAAANAPAVAQSVLTGTGESGAVPDPMTIRFHQYVQRAGWAVRRGGPTVDLVPEFGDPRRVDVDDNRSRSRNGGSGANRTR